MSTGGKILVVDDFDENREAIRDLLCFLEYEVRAEKNAEDALIAAEEFKPDVFLLDVKMPRMGGLELLELLDPCSHYREAIMMTGYENIDDACRAMELGAISYLRKPVLVEDLKKHVEQALAKINIRKAEARQKTILEQDADRQSRQLEETFRMVEFQNRRFDLIMDSIREPLIAIDTNRRIMMVNRAAEQAFDIDFGKVLDRQVDTMLPFQLPEPLPLYHSGDDNREYMEMQAPVIVNNSRYWSLSAAPLLHDRKETVGHVLVFNDVTAIIHAGQLRDLFLSIVSHEFRSPLLVLMNTASLLGMRKHCTEEMEGVMDMIVEATGKLSMLMNTIATFARLSPDNVIIHPAPLAIVPFLTATADRYLPAALRKKITLAVTGTSSTPEIMTDRELFETAAGCLLDNAIKYAPPDSTVTLRYAGNRENLIITIEDDGSGIAADTELLLFEWFKQGEDPLTRHHDGLGLGLPLARRAVELLGGEIRVETGESGGCAALIILPWNGSSGKVNDTVTEHLPGIHRS